MGKKSREILKNFKRGCITDCLGDNIASKNTSYCELTALYWIWKNDKKSKILGLCHYRRYLGYKNKMGIYTPLTSYMIKKYLNKYDMLVPTEYTDGMTLEKRWAVFEHNPNDLLKTRNAILTVCPEYIKDWDYLMSQTSIHYCNIMYAKRCKFFEYCEWLFPLMEEIERNTDLTGYNEYQVRLYGFLSEYLLPVWCNHNNIKRAYFKVLGEGVTGYFGLLKEGIKNRIVKIIRKIKKK